MSAMVAMVATQLSQSLGTLVGPTGFTGIAGLLLGQPVASQGVEWFNKPAGSGKSTPPHQDGFYFCLVPDEAVENPTSHADMHATILHLMGVDVRKLTYDYDGRVETLIGVNPARVLKEIIA